MNDHRRIRLFPGTPGLCRFCGQPVLDRRTGQPSRRRMWHNAEKYPDEPPCLQTYTLSFQQFLRPKVWERDHGICAACGLYDDDWEADHIRPRVDGGSVTLDNVQTLCRIHHRHKTARENSARKRKHESR